MRPLTAPKLIVFGEASQRVFKEITFHENERSQILMDFLRQNKVPIASSCLGEGFCRRCTVGENKLSCQITLGDFLAAHPDHICRVSYL